jgi:hypothetical protein
MSGLNGQPDADKVHEPTLDAARVDAAIRQRQGFQLF